MSRTKFDLTNFVFQVGKIGKLQTMDVIPVIAGDSISLDFSAIVRLAPLRRSLTLDAIVDLFAFYVPHRHAYAGDGDHNAWFKFIRDGQRPDATNTLPSRTLPADYFCLGAPKLSGVVPRWRVNPYNQIYNRYFKHPTDQDKDIFHANFVGPNGLKTRQFGLSCCYDKTFWTTCQAYDGRYKDRVEASETYKQTVSGNEATIDIWAREEAVAQYNNQSQRMFFDIRYNDVLQRTWGGHANIDADQRPSLLSRNRTYLSGYDVDGTSEGSLGQFGGKAFANATLRLPRIACPEHGTVWVMCLIRFPTIHESELHYLESPNQVSANYAQMAADPRIVASRKPQKIKSSDLFVDGTAVDLGVQPFGQWYRHHPNRVHSLFAKLNGFPFLDKLPISVTDAHYYDSDEADAVFQSPNQLGHYTVQARQNIMAYRVYPQSSSGLFV